MAVMGVRVAKGDEPRRDEPRAVCTDGDDDADDAATAAISDAGVVPSGKAEGDCARTAAGNGLVRRCEEGVDWQRKRSNARTHNRTRTTARNKEEDGEHAPATLFFESGCAFCAGVGSWNDVAIDDEFTEPEANPA